MGCIKFKIPINLRLLQEQEKFDEPGCSRLTALSATDLEIAVLSNKQLQYRMFYFGRQWNLFWRYKTLQESTFIHSY